MLTLEDCLGLCHLTEEEIEAIAQHEHLPEIIAVELGEYLVRSETGVPMIRKMIFEDIQECLSHGKTAQAERLNMVLKHFIATHPDYRSSGPAAEANGRQNAR
jgi:hypothetical protein